MITQMSNSKITVILLVFLLCAGAVAGGRHWKQSGSGQGPKDARTVRMRGNPSAALKMVEYIDYQCGACRIANELLHEYSDKYPSHMLVEVKFNPLASHPYGFLAAVYARCAADQGNFWAFHDKMFKQQEEWSAVSEPQPILMRIAQESGLNTSSLQACVNSPAAQQAVMEEKKQASALGVVSTPTIFINGQMVVGAPNLKQELEKHFPAESGSGT